MHAEPCLGGFGVVDVGKHVLVAEQLDEQLFVGCVGRPLMGGRHFAYNAAVLGVELIERGPLVRGDRLGDGTLIEWDRIGSIKSAADELEQRPEVAARAQAQIAKCFMVEQIVGALQPTQPSPFGADFEQLTQSTDDFVGA